MSYTGQYKRASPSAQAMYDVADEITICVLFRTPGVCPCVQKASEVERHSEKNPKVHGGSAPHALFFFASSSRCSSSM
jgi:hypothetical protein